MVLKKLKKVYLYSFQSDVIYLASLMVNEYASLEVSTEVCTSFDFEGFFDSKKSDLILIDYQAVKNNVTLKMFFQWLEKSYQKVIIIFNGKIDESFPFELIPKGNYLIFPCSIKIFEKILSNMHYLNFKTDDDFYLSDNKSFYSANNIIFEKFIGETPKIKLVKQSVLNIARTNLSLLLQGESGTGKTFLAEIIHSMSKRKNNKFIAVNMADIPENLAESELFGTVSGAFTGAVNRNGFFSMANEGTLFLDEIGEIPVSIQSKLLGVLETGKFRKIGSSKEESVDIRYIFASNKNLIELIRNGRFRQDLYYRIADYTIEIPPLRHRVEDIKLLCEHFLEGEKTVSVNAEKKLKEHIWPGNVRELKKCLNRAKALSSTNEILSEDIIF